MNHTPASLSPTILIVSSDVGRALVLSSAYRRAGYITIDVESGVDALTGLSTVEPDVILLASRVPDLPLTDLRDGIRAHPKGHSVGLVIIHDDLVDLTASGPNERRLLNPVSWHDLHQATRDVMEAADQDEDLSGQRLLGHLRAAASAGN